jgi:hypothetical protein
VVLALRHDAEEEKPVSGACAAPSADNWKKEK